MSMRKHRGCVWRPFGTLRLPATQRAALVVAAAVASLWLGPADAYVGPGAGITMLGALFAVIMAILFAVGGLLYWPIRTMRRRWRQSAAVGAPGGKHASETVSDGH